MKIKLNLTSRIYNLLFSPQKPDRYLLPDTNPLIPYDQLDRIHGIKGFIDDTRLEMADDSRYYNRKEPNIDQDIRRLTRTLKFWRVLSRDFPKG